MTKKTHLLPEVLHLGLPAFARLPRVTPVSLALPPLDGVGATLAAAAAAAAAALVSAFATVVSSRILLVRRWPVCCVDFPGRAGSERVGVGANAPPLVSTDQGATRCSQQKGIGQESKERGPFTASSLMEGEK